jgi:ankyrin repeat protein
LKIVDKLLYCGANANVPCLYEYQPLTIAVKMDNLDLAKLLMSYGADPHPQVSEEDELRVKAYHEERYESYECFKPLFVAIKRQNPEMFNLLVKHVSNEIRQTVLHYDIYKQVAVLETLVEGGVDVNAVNNSGKTPLYMAVLRADTKTAELLLKHGANPNVFNSSNNYPLCLACKKANINMIRLLLANGADPNIAADIPPLCIAARKINVESVRLQSIFVTLLITIRCVILYFVS